MKSGIFIILSIFLAGVFAPYLTSHSPYEMNLSEQFEGPSLKHPFGKDQNGGDVLSKTLYGARISLKVALVVVVTSVFIGLVAGSLAGFFGGVLDQILMRFVDMLVAIPGFILAIALVSMLGPSIDNLIFSLCATGWTSFARLARGELLHLKEKDFVLAARAFGATDFRVLWIHIIPSLLGPILVQATFAMAGTIILESGLSFLGLGAPPTEPTWGSLLNAGRKILSEAPHVSIFPGLCILLLVLGFNLLADGLRAKLDPRHR